MIIGPCNGYNMRILMYCNVNMLASVHWCMGHDDHSVLQCARTNGRH